MAAVLAVSASGCGLWTFQPDIPRGFGLTAGAVGSARTDLGPGAGWTVVATVGGGYWPEGYGAPGVEIEPSGDPAAALEMETFLSAAKAPALSPLRRVEVSFVSYRKNAGALEDADILRASMGVAFEDSPEMFHLGWAFHAGTGDLWGTGPRIGYGLGVFRERFEFYILATAYVWLGEKDDALHAGAEADVRVGVGFRM